jgi:nucleoside-diphosphate-sugar epimerase
MYGSAQAEVVDENSPLDPKTEYARSKVKAEEAIRALAGDGFSPVYLRNGTVYGVSPRMRFDTVFNDLLGQATTTGEVLVYSDGKPWRPVVHVQDVARSFEAVLNAPTEAIHNQAFNNGAESLNYRVIELAEIAVKTVPGARLRMEPKSGADQRTYKAGFGKFSKTFPNFQFKWTPVEGAHELYSAYKATGLTHADFVDKKFTRLKWLRYLLDSGRLDGSLRWRA